MSKNILIVWNIRWQHSLSVLFFFSAISIRTRSFFSSADGSYLLTSSISRSESRWCSYNWSMHSTDEISIYLTRMVKYFLMTGSSCLTSAPVLIIITNMHYNYKTLSAKNITTEGGYFFQCNFDVSWSNFEWHVQKNQYKCIQSDANPLAYMGSG